MNNIHNLRVWCQKVLPLAYDDSLSYYEVLSKLLLAFNDILNIVDNIGELTEEAVADYLEAHPELTTTVQDWSLTYKKLVKGTLSWVTPEMFGAACDGTTDDTTALQEAVDFASENDVFVLIDKSLLITNTISVPSRVRIVGVPNNETNPSVIVDRNCALAFNCAGVCNVFKNIIIKPAGDSYSSSTAIRMVGGSSYNVDGVLDGVTVYLMEIGVDCKGRNINISDCLFSHNRIGVYLDPQTSSVRGLHIENSRFHGIGEEESLGWFQNSYAIYLANNEATALTVRNCSFDQGGCCIYGYFSNAVIENNYMECFAETPIQIISPTSAYPNGNGSIIIVGNIIRGKQGSVAVGVTVSYPDHLIVVEQYGRIICSNNALSLCGEEAISVTSSQNILIDGNTVQAVGLTDTDKKAFIKLNGANVSLVNNYAQTSDIDLFTASGNNILNCDANVRFNAWAYNEHVGYNSEKQWIRLKTITAGTEFENDLPKDFIVRLSDGHTTFSCKRYSNYVSNGVYWDSATTFYLLRWNYDGNNITPLLAKYDITDLSHPTTYNSTMYVDFIVN